MCLSVFLLGFFLPGILCASWTWLTLSFPTLGKFSAIISSNIFLGPSSLSFSSETLEYECWCDRCPSALLGCLLFFFFFFFLFFHSFFYVTNLGSLHDSRSPSLALFFSSSCVTHLVDVGFDFSVMAPLLPPRCSFFVFECGVSFFGQPQHPPVDGCSTASCDFSTLAAGCEHTSFYSAILNQSLLTYILWSVVSISVLFTNFLQCYSDIFCVSVTQGPVGDLSGQLPSKFSSQSSRFVIRIKSTHVQLRD